MQSWFLDYPFLTPADRLTASLVCNFRYTYQTISAVTPAFLTPATAVAGVVSVRVLRVIGDAPKVNKLSLTPYYIKPLAPEPTKIIPTMRESVFNEATIVSSTCGLVTVEKNTPLDLNLTTSSIFYLLGDRADRIGSEQGEPLAQFLYLHRGRHNSDHNQCGYEC